MHLPFLKIETEIWTVTHGIGHLKIMQLKLWRVLSFVTSIVRPLSWTLSTHFREKWKHKRSNKNPEVQDRSTMTIPLKRNSVMLRNLFLLMANIDRSSRSLDYHQKASLIKVMTLTFLKRLAQGLYFYLS